jgi:GNAT superfamily N-acetyltransferase
LPGSTSDRRHANERDASAAGMSGVGLISWRQVAQRSITISEATDADVPRILSFIKGLAEYEKLTDLVVVTEQSLRQSLFGERRYAEVLLARLDGQAVGFALFFHNYSTFLGKPGIYLEDLFVLPEHRGQGAGKALMARIAQLAHQRGCGRLEWSVLDWNQPAIEFYTRMGATMHADWNLCRMTADGIARLAESAR